ncbi:MAG: hypothetical protein FWE13_01965 [Firmicutes bacterium]|nr:hypothetical protein [Bacillota bacterium]
MSNKKEKEYYMVTRRIPSGDGGFVEITKRVKAVPVEELQFSQFLLDFFPKPQDEKKYLTIMERVRNYQIMADRYAMSYYDVQLLFGWGSWKSIWNTKKISHKEHIELVNKIKTISTLMNNNEMAFFVEYDKLMREYAEKFDIEQFEEYYNRSRKLKYNEEYPDVGSVRKVKRSLLGGRYKVWIDVLGGVGKLRAFSTIELDAKQELAVGDVVCVVYNQNNPKECRLDEPMFLGETAKKKV